MDVMLSQMIVGGFITVTITFVIIAGTLSDCYNNRKAVIIRASANEVQTLIYKTTPPEAAYGHIIA